VRTSSILCAVFVATALYAPAAFAQEPVQSGLALDDIHVHDPWILADQPTHTYYLYTASRRSQSPDQHSGVIAYESSDLNKWSGPHSVFEVPDGSWADPTAGVWAPEVHAYNGKYYLFATLNNYKAPLPASAPAAQKSAAGPDIQIAYNGAGPHPRGTQVFVGDSPLGPFRIIVDKPIPPAEYMTLDGTFYVEDGIPYMVYAHEWTQLVDGNMEAIAMKPDLSAAAGAPFFLFKASDAPWFDDRHDTQNIPQVYVTDGPEMYRTRGGALLMLWSSYRDGLYVEALAHSSSSKLAGPWKQDGVLVGDDSGHGMLFRTFDGRLMLVLHHPFDPRLSRAKLYEIEDTGDSIRVKQN
jgi:hypothetical protein